MGSPISKIGVPICGQWVATAIRSTPLASPEAAPPAANARQDHPRDAAGRVGAFERIDIEQGRLARRPTAIVPYRVLVEKAGGLAGSGGEGRRVIALGIS